MIRSKADIIAQLQKEILPLQGFRQVHKSKALDAGLGPIINAFPQASFPLGAIHEFISNSFEDKAATCGFIAALISSILKSNGPLIWISNNGAIFPPALKAFGISPDKIIFIHLQKEKEILWAMEESLKCSGLSAVIAEIQELNFTASRRLQLAVEQSQVTGFILRHNPRTVNTTACITRWMISSIKSRLPGNMPGVGFPRWKVALLKVRNGHPGNWQVEFVAGRFRHSSKAVSVSLVPKKKTG